VLALGPEFLMVALIGDGIQFNGYTCMRLRDVRKLQVPCKYAPFYEATFKKRRHTVLRKPRVNLSGLSNLLLTASQAFPLVTIHREKVDPDVCQIGRVVGLAKGNLSLLEIGPDAVWDDEPETYKMREITRVDFGGDYEDALHLVGGRPETEKNRKKPRRS